MNDPMPHTGLTDDEVLRSRSLSGSNGITTKNERVFARLLLDIVKEPMFILLVIACTVYFIVGQYQEGFIMLAAILVVTGISIFQEYRSRNAVEALKKMSAPLAKLVRNGKTSMVPTADIVVNDLLVIEEGEIVSADGRIVSANDLSVNESMITGESLPVMKAAGPASFVYRGTLVTSGSAMVNVTAVGQKTMFGKIGISLREIGVERTPLQKQIRVFVRYMIWIGAGAFLLVFLYNFFESRNFMHALMHGLTLAMSVIPEEIPVAFSTFMALGAFRLLKHNVIVRQPVYVETLGSATVICADKTGTLTQNQMNIAALYDARSKEVIDPKDTATLPAELIEYAMWSSETQPFDPMEKALHQLYERSAATDKRKDSKQVHEYPLGGTPPMMTHLFSLPGGEVLIAAKGAPEGILRQCNLSIAELKHIEEQSLTFAKKGYRVLGVGKGAWEGRKWPVAQEDFAFHFLGLIAFHDPPKENITQTLQAFDKAGIRVKMITGDYAETAMAIAGQVGLPHNHEVLTGKEVLQLGNESLRQKVMEVNVFARMFPEAKLKVIDALKENGEVVAMTGDGVNDGPALKAAHIGIAMGQRGSEVAKSAASLILVDDDLGHMVDAVALGRKIYDNLKKAIQYIVSIHIPIILIVVLPMLLSWNFPDIFSPVHVIFLELIMGPTCSIVFENEPMEAGTMSRPPRPLLSSFLSGKQLLFSMIQGLMITAACLGTGYYYMNAHADEATVRTTIFITLLFSNILLTLVNRSFRYSVITTLGYRNRLVPVITGTTLLCIAAFLYVPFARQLFNLKTLPIPILLTCLAAALAGTFWVEVRKVLIKHKDHVQ